MFQCFSLADIFDGVEEKIEGIGNRGKKCPLIQIEAPNVKIEILVKDPAQGPYLYRIKEIKE